MTPMTPEEAKRWIQEGKKPRHNRYNLHAPRPARALIEKYRHEKQQRPTFRWR